MTRFLFCLACLFCFWGSLAPVLCEDISVWIMASEVTAGRSPTPEQIEAFHAKYPHATIAIGKNRTASQHVLLANEAVFEAIQTFTDAFNARYGSDLRVHVKLVGWHTDPLGQLIADARREGVDIVQVGSTWIALLAHHEVLRDITDLVRPRAHEFINVAVQAGHYGDPPGNYAIPLSVDIRTWYYNRQLLTRAGIDVSTIRTLADLPTACSKFRQRSRAWFLGLPTAADDYSTLHLAMTWIWGWGGSIITPENRVDLLSEKVIDAVAAYVALALQGCAPLPGRDGRGLRLIDIEKDFLRDRYAFIIIGPWIQDALDAGPAGPYVNLGSLPGPDGASPNMFTGGSHLALVNSERTPLEEKAARELLTGLAVNGIQSAGLSPHKAKLEQMLRDPKMKTYPMVLLRQESRTFPTHPAWGEIEGILLNHLAAIFQTAAVHPDIGADALRAVIRNELRGAKNKIDRLIAPSRLPVWIYGATGLLVAGGLLLLRGRAHRQGPGKEELVRRFRRIKEMLHAAKVWNGRLDDANCDSVRAWLVRRIDGVLQQLLFFKKVRDPRVQDILICVRQARPAIAGYKDEILQTGRPVRAYEERLIGYFEDRIRPLINNMSDMLETYCVPSNRFQAMVAELQKLYPFKAGIDRKLGSLLIRPEDLYLCLENLLENAHKAVCDQNTPCIELQVRREVNYVTIAICDNGAAFCEDELTRLMDRGHGVKDVCNILAKWEGELSLRAASDPAVKPAVVMKIKHL